MKKKFGGDDEGEDKKPLKMLARGADDAHKKEEDHKKDDDDDKDKHQTKEELHAQLVNRVHLKCNVCEDEARNFVNAAEEAYKMCSASEPDAILPCMEDQAEVKGVTHLVDCIKDNLDDFKDKAFAYVGHKEDHHEEEEEKNPPTPDQVMDAINKHCPNANDANGIWPKDEVNAYFREAGIA